MSMSDGRPSSRKWSRSGCSRSPGILTLSIRPRIIPVNRRRLSVLAKLCDGQRQSISRLTSGTNLSRQAVTKHLRVLANAGVVRSVRIGRESLFELEPRPFEEVRNYLDQVFKQW